MHNWKIFCNLSMCNVAARYFRINWLSINLIPCNEIFFLHFINILENICVDHFISWLLIIYNPCLIRHNIIWINHHCPGTFLCNAAYHFFLTLQIIFDNILNRKIPWPHVPSDMSFEAQDLINRLVFGVDFLDSIILTPYLNLSIRINDMKIKAVFDLVRAP